jgi:outer membrane receptor protein involved in Fe transport
MSAALGLYRQDLVGISDTRDVSSVFVAWRDVGSEPPLEAVHATLGWQQSWGAGLQGSIEGYAKWLHDIPIAEWRANAGYTTAIGRADGRIWGVDLRLEYQRPGLFYGFLGYGYAWTRYEASQREFGDWFGEPVQRYHPPHDRRHQLNAVVGLEVGPFSVGGRWQLGSGLPFSRPLGFDEAFDFRNGLHPVYTQRGTTRLILDRPYQARLPAAHRMDLWIRRPFDLPFGTLEAQAGVLNVYDRRNLFYFDLYTARRVDQLPIAPYLSLRLEVP